MEAYALEGLPTDWAERINEARMRAASHGGAGPGRHNASARSQIAGRVLFGLLPESLNGHHPQHRGATCWWSARTIVMSLSHFFLGSVAERLAVRNCALSVLVVRALPAFGAVGDETNHDDVAARIDGPRQPLSLAAIGWQFDR